jgi:hypothetical protein
MINNLVKKILESGGKIKPLILPNNLAKGTGQMNPSILLDKGKIMVNLRNVQYVLIHSENQQRFANRWGCMLYNHPENDVTLRTFNFHLELDDDLEIIRRTLVDTSKLDITPVWEFIGLEDARLVGWDNKLFMCGVRRDTKPDGEGRMELSEIEVTPMVVKEIKRTRIEPPVPSYCEKNWMPVLDMPFHFVKWTNPTQVVKVNMETKTSEQVFLSDREITGVGDFRGGSQVITVGDNRMALIHEVRLFNNELGQKDGIYYHRFIVWDKDWNIVKYSDLFNFMGGRVEFSCGMAIKGDKLLIPFGFQDNTSYIIETPLTFLESLIWNS